MAARRGQAYVYGNTVLQPNVAPERREELIPSQPKKVSTQVRKNRRKALHMSTGYVAFLAAAAVLVLVVCVSYLYLQSEVAGYSKKITTLQQELSATKEENNTRYGAIMNAVSLEDVRNKAINELGMVYATPGQVVGYQNQTGDDVKQYESIPKSGVIASSRKTEN